MPLVAPDPARDSSRGRTVTAPWSVIASLTLTFVLLGFWTAGTNTLAIDLRVSGWVQGLDGRLAQGLARIGDELGETATALAGLAVGVVAAVAFRKVQLALFLAIAALLRLLATELKGVFDSPRPTVDQVELVRAFESTGFPSGHATTASLLMGTLAYAIAQETDRGWIRGGLVVLWLAGVAVTAFARIWYGAHWVTDTFGGIIVGLVIVLLAANVSAAIMGWRSSGQRRAGFRMPTRR